jgi:hypothetical protein
MNDSEWQELKRRLLRYPGATEDSVEKLFDVYQEREKVKRSFIEQRRCSNALAETYLDRKGYPRPPGLHSVFFYPGGYRPRNLVVFWLAVLIAVTWFFTKRSG